MKLPIEYFQNDDVVSLAKDLLGKYIFTKIDGQLSGGIITETEAYNGVNDKASHSYGGRRTTRNEMMYHPGGVAYVYLCYGMHRMMNIVTNKADIPDAVLLRAILPTHGEELMLQRLGYNQMSAKLTDGPGKLSKALGINIIHNGTSLNSTQLWLEDRGIIFDDEHIRITPRIGVDYAGEDALLPYRFVAVNCEL